MAHICQFCLMSGMLCPKCQSKLDSGEVSDLDLKIARILLTLEKDFPSLQEVKIYSAVNADGTLALIVGRGDVARVLSYGGKIIKEISKRTRKKIRILEHGVGTRKFLEDLFAPMNIVTINKIWLPDGTTETRIILKEKSRRISKQRMKALKEIAKKVQGITLRIEFAK